MLRCAPRGPASPTRGNRVCVSRGGRRLGYERQAQIRTDCFLSRVFGGRATAAFRALLVRILVRSRAPLEARRREQERRPTRRRGNVSGLAPLAPCFSGSRPWWRGAGTPRANNKHVASCSPRNRQRRPRGPRWEVRSGTTSGSTSGRGPGREDFFRALGVEVRAGTHLGNDWGGVI